MTVTDIVNYGLIQMGADPITDINSTDEDNAIDANRIWATVRDAVLSDPQAEWSVAVARTTLAQAADTNMTPYDYLYQLPEDPRCLRVIGIIDVSSAPDYRLFTPDEAPYIIEGRLLAFDQDQCAIKYIKQVTDPADFDALLSEAMGLAVAARLAYKATQSRQVVQDMYALYAAKRLEAAGADAKNRWQGYRTSTSLSDVRIAGQPTRERFYENGES